MSKDYENIKNWYNIGVWNIAKMKAAVAKGKITAEEYKAITGKGLLGE